MRYALGMIGDLAGGFAEGLDWAERRNERRTLLQRQQMHDAMQMLGVAAKLGEDQPEAAQMIWQMAQQQLRPGQSLPAPQFATPERKLQQQFNLQQQVYEDSIRKGFTEEEARERAFGLKRMKPERPVVVAGKAYNTAGQYLFGEGLPQNWMLGPDGPIPLGRDRVQLDPRVPRPRAPAQPTKSTFTGPWRAEDAEKIAEVRGKILNGTATEGDIALWKQFGGDAEKDEKRTKSAWFGTWYKITKDVPAQRTTVRETAPQQEQAPTTPQTYWGRSVLLDR